MKLVIDIPKEFEQHFNEDRFADSLARLACDIENHTVSLSGRYEWETIDMLQKAFENAEIIDEASCFINDDPIFIGQEV